MSKLRIFILFFLLLSISCENSNNEAPTDTDSKEESLILQEVEKAKETEEKLEILNHALKKISVTDTLLPFLLDSKIYYHNRLKEYDSSLFYVGQLREVAQDQEDTAYQALAYYRKARIHNYLTENDSVLVNTFEARRLSLLLQDSSSAGRRSLEMAVAQGRLGDFAGSQESATEALKFLDRETDSTYLASAHNMIAAVYSNQELYEQALEEYQNALPYSKSTEDSISILNNMANVQREKGQFTDAIQLYERLLKKVDTSNISQKARLMDNLAYTRWLAQPERDISGELQAALALREAGGDEEGLLASYERLAGFYKDTDVQQAQAYAEKYLATAQALNDQASELKALAALIDISEAPESRAYARHYVRLKDSLEKGSLRSKNLFAKIKYDEERKLQQIAALEAENLEQEVRAEKLKTRIIIILLFSFLVLLALGFRLYYLRHKHKRERLEAIHRTETRISKKIHDELANDVYGVMAFLEGKADHTILDKLEGIYQRTRNISKENATIDTGSGFPEHLVETLTSMSHRTGSRIVIKGVEEISWEELWPETKVVIHRVLQEFMVNMDKHSNASLAAIVFSEADKGIRISFSDNGSSKKAIIPGNGLRNVENRISTIGGSFSFGAEEGKGFQAEIFIPH